LGSVLEEAVRRDQIAKVRLIKLERPEDRAVAATDKWIRAGAVGRLELDITARGRAERVLPSLIQRFLLGGDKSAFGEIIEFEGIKFDEAKVEVVLEDETRRTFNIEEPDSGHPFTEDLRDLEVEDGEPTERSLFAALQAAL